MPWDNSMDLPEIWIRLSFDSWDKTLTPNEVNTIKRVRSMSDAEIELKFDKIMSKDRRYFDDVSAQIESVNIFWSRVIEAKEKRDKLHARGIKSRLYGVNFKNYLVGLSIIPQRLNIGMGRKHTRHASIVSSDDDLAKMVKRMEDKPKRGRKTERKAKRSTRTGFFPTEESRLWGQAKLEPATSEDSASSSEESVISEKGKRRGRKNEPERERKTKRSTRIGKTLRHASKESAARRWWQSAKESESESATAEDSASSSEDSAVSRKGKRRGRKNAKYHAQPKVENTQRQEEIRKIIEKELMLHPLDDENWGGRLPKVFKERYSQFRPSKESKSAAAKNSGSDHDTTDLSRLDSSASEESTLSRKRTRRGRTTTKASTRQRQIWTRKQDLASSEESAAGEYAAGESDDESAAEEPAAEEPAAGESAEESAAGESAEESAAKGAAAR
ncbi:hypothetical protein F5883DRAFT_653377 [Diaporthe sp. PMI_573]|nr:hypothetical protein F5883DRAFT_653377 [Diaporthaceae sp. PMI_573]